MDNKRNCKRNSHSSNSNNTITQEISSSKGQNDTLQFPCTVKTTLIHDTSIQTGS